MLIIFVLLIKVSESETINLLKDVNLSEKSETLKNINFFYQIQNVNKVIITFCHNEIEKGKLHHYKSPTFIRYWFFEDIDKVFIFNKVSFGEKTYKYFIG